jgi:hypothetical protein
MMKQQNYLFVGGSHDGSVMPFLNPEEEFTTYGLTQHVPKEELDSSDDSICPLPESLQRERYILSTLRTNENHLVYRHESLSMDGVLIRLPNN